MAGRHEKLKKEQIDKVVDDRIKGAIEMLQEHVATNLGSYENFLKTELSWIETERKHREIRAKPMPGAVEL